MTIVKPKRTGYHQSFAGLSYARSRWHARQIILNVPYLIHILSKLVFGDKQEVKRFIQSMKFESREMLNLMVFIILQNTIVDTCRQ